MRIQDDVYRALVGHCLDEASRTGWEACGVLASPVDLPGRATAWFPVPNVHEHPDVRFRLDPDHQVALWRGLDRLNLRPRIIYHSHLDTPPVMSEEDLKYTQDPDIFHLVVSLSERTPRLWKVTGGRAWGVSMLVYSEVGTMVSSKF